MLQIFKRSLLLQNLATSSMTVRAPLQCASRFVRDEFEDLPRITCPQKMVKKLEKKTQQKFAKKQAVKRQSRHRGPLIISCKRSNYNFHEGQSFNALNASELVSCGWKNTKRNRDSFTLVPHSDNPSLQPLVEETVTFHDLGLNDRLCSGLEELGFGSPTLIQKYAIPALLRGDNTICAAETGSGKTLTYLLPAVEWILHQKNIFQNRTVDWTAQRTKCPNTMIITPSVELTQQIMSVAELLRPYGDFLPVCVAGGHGNPFTYQPAPVDMLVATPGLLKRLIHRKQISGKGLRHLVIDESDTLLDDSFISDLEEIFKLLQISPVDEIDEDVPILGGTQVVLVSATMPRNIEDALRNILPVESMNKITTPSLHQLPPHVPQKFIRINPDAKPEKLIHLLKTDLKKKHPALVFVKNNNTCHYVFKLLQSNGLECLKMSSDGSKWERSDMFKKFKEGYCDIMVATDVASRGLDTTNVHHVINYDFPTFISDYIHRVGRVGRVGTRDAGHATSFVSHKWDVELLWKIEIAARKMKRLDHVDANIKRTLNEMKSLNEEYELNF